MAWEATRELAASAGTVERAGLRRGAAGAADGRWMRRSACGRCRGENTRCANCPLTEKNVPQKLTWKVGGGATAVYFSLNSKIELTQSKLRSALQSAAETSWRELGTAQESGSAREP